MSSLRLASSAIQVSMGAYTYVPPSKTYPFKLTFVQEVSESRTTVQVNKAIKTHKDGSAVYGGVLGRMLPVVIKYWPADRPYARVLYQAEMNAYSIFAGEPFMPQFMGYGQVISGLKLGLVIVMEKRGGLPIGPHLKNCDFPAYEYQTARRDLEYACSRMRIEGVIHVSILDDNILWDSGTKNMTIVGWQWLRRIEAWDNIDFTEVEIPRFDNVWGGTWLEVAPPEGGVEAGLREPVKPVASAENCRPRKLPR
ncbi:hypothetical protein TWF281_003734 [Arthrobotrys megalospora]